MGKQFQEKDEEEDGEKRTGMLLYSGAFCEMELQQVVT